MLGRVARLEAAELHGPAETAQQEAQVIAYVRRLIDLLGRRNLQPNPEPRDPEPVHPLEACWNKLIKARGCYHCDKEPKGFIEGPSGGMSTNVFCSQCGQGYNLTPIAHWAEEIHKDEKYIVKETP